MLADDMIATLMEKLNITEDEALEIAGTDKAIDKGADPFPLTAEQKQVEKKMRCSAGRKPTVYNFKQRERKADLGKREFISAIAEMLTELDTEVEVLNPERELTFISDNRKYKIVLSCPRS